MKSTIMIIALVVVAAVGCSTLNNAGLLGKKGIAAQQLKDDWAFVKAQLITDSVAFTCANEAAFTKKASELGVKPSSGKTWDDVFKAFCPAS